MHYNFANWSNPIKRTFLGLTDAQRFELAVTEINKLNPDLVILNGDIGEINQVSAYRTMKSIFEEFNAPWYISKGNHDCISYNDWKTVFDMDVTHGIDDFYSFEYEDYAFVCVNPFQTPNGGNWTEVTVDETELESILDSYSDKDAIFVFSHWISRTQTRDLIMGKTNVKCMFFGHTHVKAYTITLNNKPIFTNQHFSTPYQIQTQRYYDRNLPWAFRITDIDDNENITSVMKEIIYYPPRPRVTRTYVPRIYI